MFGAGVPQMFGAHVHHIIHMFGANVLHMKNLGQGCPSPECKHVGICVKTCEQVALIGSGVASFNAIFGRTQDLSVPPEVFALALFASFT